MSPSLSLKELSKIALLEDPIQIMRMFTYMSMYLSGCPFKSKGPESQAQHLVGWQDGSVVREPDMQACWSEFDL